MSKRKGFTLIEMLVVVLIIGIIAAIALPQYQKAVLKSRYTQLMVMGDAIHRAQDAYYLAHGKYSLKINDLDITIPGDCTLSNKGGTITCSKFRCVVNDGWVNADINGIAYCNTPKETIYYMIYPLRRNTKRYCTVSPDSDLGKKVCESFGGRFAFVGSANGLWHYQL